MFKELKKILQHSSIYLIGNLGIKLLGLILIPFYTNVQYLTSEDFGALSLLEATLQLITGILGFAISQGLTRWYWDKKNKDKQKSMFFTAFSFLFVISIFSISFLLSQSENISILIFNNLNYIFVLKLTIITAVFKIINGLTLTLLKLQSKSFKYMIIQMSSLIISLFIIIYELVYLKKGLEAIWSGFLVAEFFIFISLVFFVIKNITFRFEFKILKGMLIYGYPLMLTSIAGIILLTTDRYMLNSTEGLVDTGKYSLGFKFANTLKVLISTSLFSAITPYLMKKINENKNQRYYSKIMTYTSFVFIMGLLGLSLFSFEIINMFTNSIIYIDSVGIVTIISFSLLFELIRINSNIGLIIVKGTKIIGLLTLITGIINICLNYLLIPLWNIYGAAFATLFSQFLFLIFTYILSQKKYKIPYELNKLILMISIALILVFIGDNTNNITIYLRMLFKLTLFISFPFILYLFNFYEKIEIENIKSIYSKILNKINIY